MLKSGLTLAQADGQRYLINTASYTFLVSFDSNLIESGVATNIEIALEPPNYSAGQKNETSNSRLELTLRAQKIDGAAISLAPVSLKAQSDGWHGQLYLPQPGNWLLEVEIVGSGGVEKGETSIVVSPPPVLPSWTAWIVATSPLLIAGFLIVVSRRLQLKKRQLKTSRKLRIQEE